MEAFGHVHFKPEYSEFANVLFENIRKNLDDISKPYGCITDECMSSSLART